MQPPADGDDWLGLTDAQLPIGPMYEWCVRPDCGAVVLFSGTVRDHADGRTDVQFLEYEAYDEMVVPKLAEIVIETRTRWPDVVRVALVHRVGRLELGESSVVAAVSAPHRPEAFAAARFAIDALKVSVPVWKREVWQDGSDWGTNAAELVDAGDVASPGSDHGGGAPMTPLIAIILGVVLAVVILYLVSRSRRSNDGVDSFRRQIDALSPEARRPVIDQINKSPDRSDPPVDPPIDPRLETRPIDSAASGGDEGDHGDHGDDGDDGDDGGRADEGGPDGA